MLISRMVGVRPEKNRRSWTPLEHGLWISILVGMAAISVGIVSRF